MIKILMLHARFLSLLNDCCNDTGVAEGEEQVLVRDEC